MEIGGGKVYKRAPAAPTCHLANCFNVDTSFVQTHELILWGWVVLQYKVFNKFMCVALKENQDLYCTKLCPPP